MIGRIILTPLSKWTWMDTVGLTTYTLLMGGFVVGVIGFALYLWSDNKRIGGQMTIWAAHAMMATVLACCVAAAIAGVPGAEPKSVAVLVAVFLGIPVIRLTILKCSAKSKSEKSPDPRV